MPRYFVYRYGGVRQVVGPASGLSYTFSMDTVTTVSDERDAEIFLHMGSPDSGFYLFRETDQYGNPIGPFPPVDMANRQSMINPKRFPSDRMAMTTREWRVATEDMADPTLYFHFVRRKLNFGRGGQP
jgi:hypothetical protein